MPTVVSTAFSIAYPANLMCHKATREVQPRFMQQCKSRPVMQSVRPISRLLQQGERAASLACLPAKCESARCSAWHTVALSPASAALLQPSPAFQLKASSPQHPALSMPGITTSMSLTGTQNDMPCVAKLVMMLQHLLASCVFRQVVLCGHPPDNSFRSDKSCSRKVAERLPVCQNAYKY